MAWNPFWHSYSNHLAAWYYHCNSWHNISASSHVPLLQHPLYCCLTHCNPGHHFGGRIFSGAPLCSLVWPFQLWYTQIYPNGKVCWHPISRYSQVLCCPIGRKSLCRCTFAINHLLRAWIPPASHGRLYTFVTNAYLDAKKLTPFLLVFGGQNNVLLLENSFLHVTFARKPKIPHLCLLIHCTHCQYPHRDLLPRAWILSLTFLYHKVKMLSLYVWIIWPNTLS